MFSDSVNQFINHVDIHDICHAVNGYMPAVMQLSPITLVGFGIASLGALAYLATRANEFLIVVATAMMYSAIPLIPHG